MRNTENAYGLIAKILHWVMAVLILMMLVMGFTMRGLEDGPDKLWVFGLHKSIGILILMLVSVRILWKLINITPKPLPTHAPWEKALAHSVHFVLYGAMLAMPMTGWIMSSAGDFRNSFFGLFEMPDIAPKNEDLLEAMRDAHEIIAFAIIGFFGLHVAGALKHHFIDRDETLKRMTARRVGFKAGAVLTLLVGAVAGIVILQAGRYALNEFGGDDDIKQTATETERSVTVEPITDSSDSGWVIDREHSRIEFEATQYGEAFKGSFENFNGQIVFDPDELDKSSANIKIDITSIETGASDRDDQAKSADWFDVAQFPLAVFSAESFEKTGENQYLAHGSLTIRGIAVPVALPFELKITEDGEGNRADMEAVTTLRRLDFGIGQGQWQETDAIGNDVKVSIKVRARRP